MPDAPTIRHYEPKDLNACRALWVELSQRHRDLYEDQAMGDHTGEEFDEHLARVGPDNLWLAVREGTVVGMAGLMDAAYGKEVEPVVITESARGAGVGRALLEALTGAARERGIQQLVVRPVARNAEALAFFLELGFCTIGQLELLWRSGGKPRWSKPGAEVSGVAFDV